MASDAPIVVGVDGSGSSVAAAEFAGDEAARRGRSLEIVHALAPPVLVGPVGTPPDLPPVGSAPDITMQALREQADQLLHEAAERVRARHPDLPMITRRHDGAPAEVLTAASHHAHLVIVGHRGAGGFAELLLGAVGVQLANHATCPVIIVRGAGEPDGPVVVGVDGSENAHRAAEFAADAAGRYQAPLIALYGRVPDPGWAPQDVQAGNPPPSEVPDPVAAQVERLTRDHPSVRVRPQVQHELPPHEALVAASKHARLVVVGARGRGGFRGLLLGSVSQALIHHAECPVAVVGPGAPQPSG